tara:strand:- start:109 stop:948 length:840 start_codon:yes stop_codon:yes gene_type:complete
MKTLPIAIVSVSLLFLSACGGDSSEPAASSANTDATAASPDAADTLAPDTASSNSYSGFDIGGLYLGMSPEEVTAALKAHDPDIVIKQDAVNFTYTALNKRHRTDSYVNYMGGSVPGGDVSLEVRFSYPPEPLAAVAVYRRHRQSVEPVSQALYVESLIEKYGTPALDSGTIKTGSTIERTLDWPIGTGTVQCMPGGAEVQSTPPVLDRIERQIPGSSAESVATCISTLRYVLRGDPVLQANGGMMDVAAAAKAEFASRAWIQSLVDEKSRAGTEKPKL